MLLIDWVRSTAQQNTVAFESLSSRREFLSGVEPMGLAASKLNPVVGRRN